MCTEATPLLPGSLRNARDLGGLPLATGRVACNRLIRAAVPTGLPASGCADFTALGITTLIDLRVASERQSVPASDCVAASLRTVLAPMPIPYAVSPADYLRDLHTDASVLLLFETLGDEANYPVLFHCTYGRDRSAVAAALVLLVLGADRETIQRDNLRTAENGLGAYPASLDAVLDEVEAAGGIDAYLASIGVPDAHLATLRRLARE